MSSPLEAEREATIQQLCEQFASDRLTTQELDSALDAAYRAKTSDELRALINVLPVPADNRGALAAQDHAATLSRVNTGTPLRVAALFASIKKQGDWEPAPVTNVSATFGEVVLDLREARIPAGLTTVHVSATFGSIEIILPPGLHVQCDGSATMGEFKEYVSMSAAPGDDAPMIRITGDALFAEVTVATRLPGESRADAKRRERARR